MKTNVKQNGTLDEFVPVESFNDGMYLEDTFYDDFDDELFDDDIDDEDYFDDFDEDIDDEDYDDFDEDIDNDFDDDASPELFGRRRRRRRRRGRIPRRKRRRFHGRGRGGRRPSGRPGRRPSVHIGGNHLTLSTINSLKTKVESIDNKVSRLTSAHKRLAFGVTKISKNQLKLNSKIEAIDKKIENMSMMEMIKAISGPNITSMNITDGPTTKNITVNSTQSDTSAALLPMLLNGGLGGDSKGNNMSNMLPLLALGGGDIDPMLLLLMSNQKS